MSIKIIFQNKIIRKLIMAKKKNAELSAAPIYELPNTKQVLSPLIEASEKVAAALANGKIDFAEWVQIVWSGIPIASALQSLQGFVAETRIINQIPEARRQLMEWFAAQFELQGPENAKQVEWVVENTISLAMQIWTYITGMQKNFAVFRK